MNKYYVLYIFVLYFLKKGVAADLTLFDLGDMMSRKSHNEPSLLEQTIHETEQICTSNGDHNEQSSFFYNYLGERLDKMIAKRKLKL